MKTVLVTGSSGFLGSKVSECLLRTGYRVVGIDIRPDTNSVHENFSFLNKDVNSIEIEELPEIDFVIHTASSLPYGSNAIDFMSNNVNAARFVCEISKMKNAFLVEIGSSSVYGKPKEVPVNSLTALEPLDEYAKSKAEAERIIRTTLSEDMYCIIRPRTILGTGRTGIFAIFFSLISRRLPLPLPNSGNQIIQFVHVEDLANLSVYLGKKRINGIWPAASPHPLSLKAYLELISRESGLEIRYLPINPSIFKIIGNIAYRLRITKFTPWHFGAFPYDNYVDSEWVPAGFEYRHTSFSAFEETFLSNHIKREGFPFFGKLGLRV